MAINTDTAAYGKSGLGEREVSHQGDFHDTEKLLSSTTTEPMTGGESNTMNPSDTFTLNTRGSVQSLDAEQMGQHRAHLKSGSVGNLAATPRSCSRLSLGPPLSPVPRGTEPPPSYLWLAVLSCFCLGGLPFNICALWYAHVSRSVLLTGDVQAATKFGRRSMLLSSIAIVVGVAVIVFIVLRSCAGFWSLHVLFV